MVAETEQAQPPATVRRWRRVGATALEAAVMVEAVAVMRQYPAAAKGLAVYL